MTQDLEKLLAGAGGAKTAQFTSPGDMVTGPVIEAYVRDALEFGTGAPMHWQDGSPRQNVVVVVQADGVPPTEEDDGKRAIYIKWWGQQREAFTGAIKSAGVVKPEPGDRFTATYTGDAPSRGGGFPAKVFEYRVQPMQASADAQWASAPSNDLAEKVKRLRDLGMSDDKIAAALEVPIEQVQDATPF